MVVWLINKWSSQFKLKLRHSSKCLSSIICTHVNLSSYLSGNVPMTLSIRFPTQSCPWTTDRRGLTTCALEVAEHIDLDTADESLEDNYLQPFSSQTALPVGLSPEDNYLQPFSSQTALPVGSSQQVQKEWHNLLTTVKQFFFSKRDRSRTFCYPLVRKLILKLTEIVPSASIKNWIAIEPLYWMALFESLDILIQSKPSKCEMEQNQFSLDFDSENFMNDEERWINWLVFGLRDCTNVLNDVRECVPVNQIMTLLKVMDRWNLWKQGDEYLIAYAINGCHLMCMPVLADILDLLMSHGRPILPILQSVPQQIQQFNSGKRINGVAYHISRMGRLAKQDLLGLMDSHSINKFADVNEIRDEIRAWENIQNEILLIVTEGVTKSYYSSKRTIRDADFYCLRIGNFIRRMAVWPYSLRLHTLQTSISAHLKELPFIDLSLIDLNNAWFLFSYLDQLSHLFGSLCFALNKAIQFEYKLIFNYQILKFLDNSDINGSSMNERICKPENPIYCQIVKDLSDAANRWRPILEPVASGDYDELLEEVRAGQLTNARKKRSISVKKFSSQDVSQDESSGLSQDESSGLSQDESNDESQCEPINGLNLLASVPEEKVFQTSAKCMALISLDLMSQGPSSFSISSRTEFIIGQILSKAGSNLDLEKRRKLRMRLSDAGVRWDSELFSILNGRNTIRNTSLIYASE